MKKYLGLLLILICSVAVFSSCEKAEQPEIYTLEFFSQDRLTLSYDVISLTNPEHAEFSSTNVETVTRDISLNSGDSLRIHMEKTDNSTLATMHVSLRIKGGGISGFILSKTIDKAIPEFDTLIVIQ